MENIILNCKNCNKPLPGRKPYNGSKTGFVFCNVNCSCIYFNKNFVKNQGRKKTGKCKTCSTAIRKKYTYCKVCYQIFLNDTLLINKNLMEATGKYDDNEASRYTSIREHARNVYKKSEKPYTCKLCNYSKYVQICHIKPIGHFTQETLIFEINDIDNLIALCPNCHWETDNKLIQKNLKVKTINIQNDYKILDVGKNVTRKHARYTYANSNKPYTCFICNYSKHVQICHIKPVSKFAPETLISEVNNINNLVALCPNCHWEFDHGITQLIPKFQ